MTELTFLIELLLNHKLPVVTKMAVAARVKEVEASFLPSRLVSSVPVPSAMANQAASMQAIMARNPDLVAIRDSEPVAVVAQTPAAVAAMNSRAEAINASMSGKVDKTTGRPRKF